MSVVTIILAAGSSSRLGGEAKQLLRQDGQTLVRRMAQLALSLQAGPVIAVLGANEAEIRAELIDLPVQITTNPAWHEGLASSLRTGLTVIDDSQTDAFLIVLTDQPYVTADLLQQLIATYQQTNRGIVACRYGEPGNLGVPALFALHYKAAFLRLSGDVGARKLIQQHLDDCAEVAFPLATVDLDTWQDVEAWRNGQKGEGSGS